MCPQLNANRTGMDGVAFFIRESHVLVCGAVATHGFVGPLVSHCCATVFLLLVQKKVSKEKDTRHSAGLRRSTAMRSSDGMPAELGSLWRSSNMLRAPAQCAGHPSPLHLSVAALTGRNTGRLARSPESLQLRTELSPVTAFCRITPLANPIYKKRDLERVTASLPVFTPWRSAEQRSADGDQAAGCLSVASSGCAPTGRAAQGIGA